MNMALGIFQFNYNKCKFKAIKHDDKISDQYRENDETWLPLDMMLNTNNNNNSCHKKAMV